MVSLMGEGLRNRGTRRTVCRPPSPWGLVTEGLTGKEQPLRETEVQGQAK